MRFRGREAQALARDTQDVFFCGRDARQNAASSGAQLPPPLSRAVGREGPREMRCALALTEAFVQTLHVTLPPRNHAY